MSIRDKYLTEETEAKVAVGDRVMVMAGMAGNECIVAFLNNGKCCLIELSSGNRWADDVKVKDKNNISPVEMKKMTGNAPYKKKG